MLRGKHHTYDEIEFYVSASGTVTGSGPQWVGVLESFFIDHPLLTSPGVYLYAAFLSPPSVASDSRRWDIEIPAFGIDETVTALGTGSPESRVILRDVVLIEDIGANWKLTVDEVEWYVDGVSQWVRGPYSYTSSMPSTPATIPVFGIPPKISGGANFSTTFSRSCTSGISEPFVSNEAEGTVLGGWRWKIGGAYVIPDCNCLCTSPDISAPNIYEIELNNYNYQDNNGVTKNFNSHGGYVYAWPTADKSVERLNADYEALIYRAALPGVPLRTVESGSDLDCDNEGTSYSTTTYTATLPELTEFLQTVGSSVATIEDPFSYPTYAPFEHVSEVATATTTGVVTDVVNSSFGLYLTGTAAMPNAYEHPNLQAMYANSWAAPHWSFCPWFPPDTASDAIRWNLDGALNSPTSYWYALRQQHIQHPSLPSGENTLRRVNVVAEPIDQNGIYGLWWLSLIGLPCQWGTNCFTVETESFPTSFTTNSTSATRFTFPSGTGTVGASVQLTTGNNIEFDLASYTVYPMMATTLSDRISVTWSDANIATVKLFAVGSDGSEVQIGPTAGVVSAASYRIPFGNSLKWATSAGIEFGAGELTDNYTPDAGVSADDVTVATLADNERVSSFGLLPGYSPVKIRIEIARAGVYTGAVTIQHPTFYQAPWTDAKVFHESGSVGTVLFKTGPMVRVGALRFFDYATDTILSSPLVQDPVGYTTTIGDMWCFENCFLRGLDAQDSLGTRMAAEYETYELPDTEDLWREPENSSLTSISGVFPSAARPRLWYLNTFRNLPPTSVTMRKKRDATLAESGAYGQYTYTDIGYKHPHIVPGNTVQQLNNGGTDHLALETSVDGWTVQSFSEAVTNNEAEDWMYRWSGVDWFEMRPWRGQVFMGMASEEAGEPLTYDVLQNLRHCLGYIKSGTAWLSHSESNSPYSWVDIDTGETADYFDIAYHDGSGALYLSIVDAGAITLYKTSDEGGTLTTVMTLGSGDYSAMEWTPNNLLYAYRLDSGGTLYGRVLDAAGNTIVSETATNLTGLDQAPFNVRVSVNSSQKQVIGATYKLGGNRLFKTAPDGFTFS